LKDSQEKPKSSGLCFLRTSCRVFFTCVTIASL
jgi:hypothetical protein